MPQPKKGPRFGNTSAHHDIMMSNLATELIRHGRIRTTHAKAKTVQPLAERMITFARRGDLHSRRQVLKVIRDKDVVHKLFADVGPAFAQRDGGYTRVLKLGPRKGDAAPMALIELVEGVAAAGEGELTEAPRRRWSLRRSRGTLSTTARERTEERAAAVDRGEMPELEDFEEYDEAEDASRVGTEPEDAPQAGPEPDEEAPQADPAEVEARLAAQEEAEASDDVTDEPSSEDEAPQADEEPDDEPDESERAADEDEDKA